MSNFEFQDILNMQYPNPEIEKDFPDKILRAAQFAPFAALTGYDEAVIETARLTDRKLELDEYTKEELNRKLNFLKDNLDDLPETSITYFVPDSKKAGGKYVTKKGYIKKIREFESDVVFDDDTEILIDDILYVENDLFTEIE